MKGVLLLAYGSPDKPDDIEPYYTDIRRGRKPSPELLEELTARYKAIGGASPLNRITLGKAEALQKELGAHYRVFVGMRHWSPWISDAVSQMAEAGITDAVAIVMAPHYSAMSIEKYVEKVEDANLKLQQPIRFQYIRSWHDEPLYLEALSEKINEAMLLFSPAEQKDLTVIFTAHSLPERILSEKDPYRDQLMTTSRLLAGKEEIHSWRFAFQSAGRTEEKWLGPDLLQVIHELAAGGKRSILVCSVGFISDHLEVLYDIDIEARAEAQKLGVHLERTRSLNVHPLLIEFFKRKVHEMLPETKNINQ